MLRPSNAAQPPMKDPTVKVKPVPSPKCHSSGSQRCSNRFTLPKWDASAGSSNLQENVGRYTIDTIGIYRP